MNQALNLMKLAARLNLPLRRRLLRTVWLISTFFRKDVGFDLEPLLQKVLRLGWRDVSRIAREHEFHDFLQIMEWHASTCRSKDQMIRDVRATRICDPDLARRVAETDAPVILAPLHMGIFPLGLTYVLWRYFEGRRVLILRAREDDHQDTLAMQRLEELATEVHILNVHNKDEFIDAMRFARKNAVVISLIDLPGTYGSPQETVLFGTRVEIALGLGTMARMLKAVVLPMAVHSTLSGEKILFGQPFEIADVGERSRQALARSLAQEIEKFVLGAPEQWHMWTRFPEFIAPPGLQGAAPADDSEVTDAVA